MPWIIGDIKLLREEFTRLALQAGASITLLCQQFHISRKTGYKWIARAKQSNHPDFSDHSKRPHHIIHKISKKIQEDVIIARCLHPHWGAKKIKAYLLNRKIVKKLPSLRTIHNILVKEELTNIHKGERHKAYKRFEYAYPNALWQMDFKGYFSLLDGSECHPFTIIDDHSRYLVCLKACIDESMNSVRPALMEAFSRYGLPESMALDNGSCWKPKSRQRWSELTVWLMRLGIQIIHGKPYHPQSRGKDERLHRTLKLELINDISMNNLRDSQRQFDLWRHQYNHTRPHEALNMKPPVTRYQISKRRFYNKPLPPIQYWEDDIIRRVDMNGFLHVAGRNFLLSKALRYQPVALRPSRDGKKIHIFFCQQQIMDIKHPGTHLSQGRGIK